MTGPSSRLFLERPNYRRRRLADAARCLPLLGAALWLIPVLWPRSADPLAGQDAVGMSQAMLYVFGVWIGLIGLAALFGIWARDLARTTDDRDRGGRLDEGAD
jgi:hypothetical protein